MKRGFSLWSFACIPIGCLCITLLSFSLAAQEQPIVIENPQCRIELDKKNGRLLRLLDKEGNIDLKTPLAIADNFRLLAPTPEDPNRTIFGRDQSLTSAEVSPETAVLKWAGPLLDAYGKEHAISAVMKVELKGPDAQFQLFVTNNSGAMIREAWYPAIGGLLDFGPTNARPETVLNPPPFGGKKFTLPFGQAMASYPAQNMGFVSLDNPVLDRGLYLGAHDPVARFKAFSFLENSAAGATNVAAWMIHYPFIKPGGTFVGAPFVARFHKGGWIAAGREIYRPWFIRTFGLMKPEEDWIRENSFFQMIMIMLPEGNVNYRIPEIPRLAKDGLKYGVKSLQIAGWQFGGHDNGYPYYEPDPRLGTYKDLQKAIRECHKLGVKIYFFANVHVNNLHTEWYERELKDYNYELASGTAAWVAGWGMGTLGSRMALTTPLMAFADPSFPGMAEGHLKYFRKLAEIGADGLHLDKTFPQSLNFNPRIVMSPDQSPWEGTVRLYERIAKECRAIHPDFRVSFETAWDRSLSFGAATWWAGNMSNARKVFPELVETVGLYQPYDYIGVNDAVRNGHAIMVSPFHFNRSMDDPQWRHLAAYIRDVKQVRDALADYVFLGEPLDQSELETGERPAGGVDYAVYRNLKNGKRACIISNRNNTNSVAVVTRFSGNVGGLIEVRKPGGPVCEMKTPTKIEVEGERLAFVVEK